MPNSTGLTLHLVLTAMLAWVTFPSPANAQPENLLLEVSHSPDGPQQTATSPRLEFDVASVRQVLVNCGVGEGSRLAGGTLILRCNRNIDLVSAAYNLPEYQISMPPKLNPVLWDIEAKAAADRVPAKAEFRQMLQALLADRFKLTVHRETRDMSVYVLSLGHGGPKFAQSGDPDTPTGLQQAQRIGHSLRIRTSATMENLASVLYYRYLGTERPVINETGLAGRYDIALEAEMLSNRDSDAGNVSIFTAVQQQLGLKLEVQKRPLEFLVVDHIEKASGN